MSCIASREVFEAPEFSIAQLFVEAFRLKLMRVQLGTVAPSLNSFGRGNVHELRTKPSAS